MSGDWLAEAEDLLPWAPEDEAGLKYRQERIASALKDAYERGRLAGLRAANRKPVTS